MLKGAQFNPLDEGKTDFLSKVKTSVTFSDPSYFKTVFISGDDMMREMAELKRKQQEDFDNKVVVDSQYFRVNTRVQQSHQINKNKGILEGEVSKVGLRLGQRRMRELTGRQILASKVLANPPVSVFSKESFKQNEYALQPMKTQLDTTKTPLNRSLNMPEQRDFVRYSRQNIVYGSPTSAKRQVSPLKDSERIGPKFAAVSPLERKQ